jgi:lysophospholipase L1-like esterase
MNSPSTIIDFPVLTPAVEKRKKLKLGAFFVFLLMVAPAASELFCRFVVGLGDPPLYQSDRAMEYLLQPSKTSYRFHNRFSVNRYSMRADDFPPQKSSSNELRVMVIGDSVVYGGVRIDQSEIGTEILKRNLERRFRVPVVVANASAKGWGPPDELAYLERFGTLDADIIILELSSHDYEDAPTFIPVVGVSPDYPDKRPRLALADLFGSYFLPRYLHSGVNPADADKTSRTHSERNIAECRNAERDLFRFARAHHAKVALIQHLSLPELTGEYQTGYAANQEVAKAENVPYADDADELRAELKSGHSPFYSGDPLHPNRLGQEILAHTLQRAVNLALKSN